MQYITRTSFFWISFTLLSIVSIPFSYNYFSKAFPIVQLDITMNRAQALEHATTIAKQLKLGPAHYHQAASFETDHDVQTFVELEAGGKTAFSKMIQDQLYTPYTWKVRHFKEFEKNESMIIFKPDGTPYGFVETISDNTPGAHLSGDQALIIAQQSAQDWKISLDEFILIEKSQETKSSGRIDHTFTYERPHITIGKGFYRLQIIVSGDKTTQITHSVLIPEEFKLHYAHMRSANNSIASGANMAMLLLYIIGGCIIGIFLLARKRFVLYKTAMAWAAFITLLQTLTTINELPLAWMHYDTALSENVFITQFIIRLFLQFFSTLIFYGTAFIAAESLTRTAFGGHPRLWSSWSTPMASSRAIWGRTLAGYIIVPLEIAFGIFFYIITTTYFNWWIPSNTLVDPNIIAHYVPWLSSIALSLGAGFMEECLFRAIPIACFSLLGKRLGNQKMWLIIGFILQAIIFGACHANYPAQPAYARIIELCFFSMISGLIYIRFGLIPVIISHFTYDVFWFALPLFVSHNSGALFNKGMVLVLTFIPLLIIIRARIKKGHWYRLNDNDFNHSWQPTIIEDKIIDQTHATVQTNPLTKKRIYAIVIAGAIGIALWLNTQQFHQDAQPILINRNQAHKTADHILAQHDINLDSSWIFLPKIFSDFKNNSNIQLQHEFIWQQGGKDVYHKLLGSYLTPPNWSIRFTRWQSPIEERSNEYLMSCRTLNSEYRYRHQLPQTHAGSTLSEVDARTIADQAVTTLFNLDPTTLTPISAIATKHPARKDWTFTFADTKHYPLAQGQARISIEIAGDQVVDGLRFIYIPENWEREQQNSKNTYKSIATICSLLLYLLLSLGVVLALKNKKSTALLTKHTAYLWAILFSLYAIHIANMYPSIIASFKASEPFYHQIFTTFGILFIGILFKTSILSLVITQVNNWNKNYTSLSHIKSYIIGLSAGAFASGYMSTIKLYTPSLQPLWANYNALTAYLPWLHVTLENILTLMSITSLLLLMCIIMDHLQNRFLKHQVLLLACFILIGIAINNISDYENIPFWIITGVLLGTLFYTLYYTIAQYDSAMIPAAVSAVIITQLIQQALFNAYPGTFLSNILACFILLIVSYSWSKKITLTNKE